MKKIRVNVCLDEDIHKFAKEFSNKKRLSVSHMINQYFMKIKLNEEKENN